MFLRLVCSYILFPLFHHLRPGSPAPVTEAAAGTLRTLLLKCPIGPAQFVPLLQTLIQLLNLSRDGASEELRRSVLESAGAMFSGLGGEELGKLRGGEMAAARGHLLSLFLKVRRLWSVSLVLEGDFVAVCGQFAKPKLIWTQSHLLPASSLRKLFHVIYTLSFGTTPSCIRWSTLAHQLIGK